MLVGLLIFREKHGGSCHFGPLPSLSRPLGHVLRLISFLDLVHATFRFISACQPSNFGPSGPVSNVYFCGYMSKDVQAAGRSLTTGTFRPATRHVPPNGAEVFDNRVPLRQRKFNSGYQLVLYIKDNRRSKA
jgi:hypothetical protein